MIIDIYQEEKVRIKDIDIQRKRFKNWIFQFDM